MYKPTHIVISYYTANGKDWVGVYYTPYDPNYIREIKEIPTAHYDIGHPEDANWTCEAQYGDTIESLVKKYFPDIPLDIQEHRGKDFYVKNCNMPYHLFELEKAAQRQYRIDLGGSGWSNETIEAFILRWCNKYNGEYAAEDVATALRCYGIDPNWLDDVAKAVSEKHGGSPIYTSETDPRDEKLYESRHSKNHNNDDTLPF